VIGVAHRHDNSEVREIAPSAHCVARFRGRGGKRAPGVEAVATVLLDTLERADLSRWPPAWAVSERAAALWAVDGDLAFPLAPSDRPGRWVALTCLSRSSS